MLRAIPLCLLLLLIAAPAAGAEIRIIDGVSGGAVPSFPTRGAGTRIPRSWAGRPKAPRCSLRGLCDGTRFRFVFR